MPDGKPAGVRCPHLANDRRCTIFDRPERPAVCSSFRPSLEMCGETAEQALAFLDALEAATALALPTYPHGSDHRNNDARA